MDFASIVFGLLEAESQFPVDFDLAWQWIGYSRKDNAKSALENAGFLAGTDFQVFLNIQENSSGGRPIEKIWLTVDCFKSFAMMAGTEQGRSVRLYFLECEKELKRRVEEDQRNHRQRVVKAVVDEKATPWQRRYDKNFFDEAYRVTGWERAKKGHPPCMGNFINQSVYRYFPEGVPEELRRVNPKNESGNRPRKHHQHLSEQLGLPILSSQQAVTMAVMRLSPTGDRKKFVSNLQRACGGPYQVELPFMESMESFELDSDSG